MSTEPNANGAAAPSKPKPGLEPIQTGGDYPGVPNTNSPTSSSELGHNPFDEIIPHPSEVPHRNLILCFDGTGDQFDADVCFLDSSTRVIS
jgi:hypothetical protein